MLAFDRLVRVVARLRGDGGCDWDRAQTLATLRPHLIEEAHEVVDAIDRGAPDDVATELGDLLFLVLLMARTAEDEGGPGLEVALQRAHDKMVHRHPHVFGDATSAPGWEVMKAAERAPSGAPSSALDGLPPSLPALLRAHRVGARAASVGFDWPDVAGVRDKLDEEIRELDEAQASGVPEAVTEELGDVLFTLAQLGRFLPVGAEDALRLSTAKFERRFRRVEADLLSRGAQVTTSDATTLDHAWRRAKESP